MTFYQEFGKRAFDVCGACFGLVLSFPILVLCAALIKLTSPGPALFRQTRVGLNGRTFKILKFRTMVKDADANGPGITSGTDSRITAVGRTLRRTKLDELPQLINVLIGDMSFVGPRPEIPEYVALLTPEQRQVINCLPGITGLASIVFRNEEQLLAEAEEPLSFYERVLLPRKVTLSLEGMRRMSLSYDLGLIGMTALGIRPSSRDCADLEPEGQSVVPEKSRSGPS